MAAGGALRAAWLAGATVPLALKRLRAGHRGDQRGQAGLAVRRAEGNWRPGGRAGPAPRVRAPAPAVVPPGVYWGPTRRGGRLCHPQDLNQPFPSERPASEIGRGEAARRHPRTARLGIGAQVGQNSSDGPAGRTLRAVTTGGREAASAQISRSLLMLCSSTAPNAHVDRFPTDRWPLHSGSLSGFQSGYPLRPEPLFLEESAGSGENKPSNGRGAPACAVRPGLGRPCRWCAPYRRRGGLARQLARCGGRQRSRLSSPPILTRCTGW
jgi:hypothetical protein